jgi:predicted nucleotidyltransferase
MDEIERYAGAIADRLGSRVTALYLQGSAVLGGYDPGVSDIDMVAVSPHGLMERDKQSLVDALRHEALPCPAAGLELVLYSEREVASPSRSPRFELNLNTGPRRPFHVAFGPGLDEPHWFVLDLAVTRAHGRALVGPPPDTLIAPIPRMCILAALIEALDWHDRRDAPSPNRVLNACRAWRFVAEGVWCAKAEGAAWARARTSHSAVIDEALALRMQNRFADLDPVAAGALTGEIRAVIVAGVAGVAEALETGDAS